MRAYSLDIRERIISALSEEGYTQAEAAERFSVSLSFVQKLWLRWCHTGSCAAYAHSGGKTRILKGHEEAIREEVERQPDATLEEVAERVARRERMKQSVSRPTMCRELQRLSLPLKGSRSTPTRGTVRG
jgi:transposase